MVSLKGFPNVSGIKNTKIMKIPPEAPNNVKGFSFISIAISLTKGAKIADNFPTKTPKFTPNDLTLVGNNSEPYKK